MTYVKLEYICDRHESSQPNWLTLAMMRAWIATLCYFLGLTKEEFLEQIRERYRPSRHHRRQAQHDHNKPIPPARDLDVLEPLLPRPLGVTLTRMQTLERTARLSSLGRFQIYDFLYYRWEFWRIGAICQRASAPLGANGPMPQFQTCGLSPAHVPPD